MKALISLVNLLFNNANFTMKKQKGYLLYEKDHIILSGGLPVLPFCAAGGKRAYGGGFSVRRNRD